MEETLKINGDNLKFIFGLKLKKIRAEKGYSLKELADKTGVSPSYLNEIEKGKKYPKPEKIIELSKALDISFDELVSLNAGNSFQNISNIFTSLEIKNLPLQLFGITPMDILELTTNSPDKASALLGTLLNIARTYDMKFEHFFFAALRSYQEMHDNYFQDLEDEVLRFVTIYKVKADEGISARILERILKDKFNYKIKEKDFDKYPEISNLRSVWVKGNPVTLLLNKRLSPAQKNFVLGRELGYNFLKLKDRPETSTWVKADSFDHVLNNFKASYFAGALLINKEGLARDIRLFFEKTDWDGQAFLTLIDKYQATPETFIHRLSEILPREFGLRELHFLKFENVPGTNKFDLTKELNMSNIAIPHGIALNEHYCNRWLSVSLLKDLSARQFSENYDGAIIATQHSRHLQNDREYFCITVAMPFPLATNKNISLTLGFSLTEKLKSTIKFWDHPGISYQVINDTCERCPLTEAECIQRVAAPTVYNRKQAVARRNELLKQFISES